MTQRTDLATPTVQRQTPTGHVLLLAAALALVPWLGYLAVSLPATYVVTGWSTAWVGFDVALIAVLGAAAWATRARPDLVAPLTLSAGELLFADAWFDVTTATGSDVWAALASAVCLELPLGVMFVRHALAAVDPRGTAAAPLPAAAARSVDSPRAATLRPAPAIA